MAASELLQSDLTARAEFVGTDDGLSTDERAQIDAGEVLSASCAQGRVRDVTRRSSTIRMGFSRVKSPNVGRAERRTRRGLARVSLSQETTIRVPVERRRASERLPAQLGTLIPQSDAQGGASPPVERNLTVVHCQPLHGW